MFIRGDENATFPCGANPMRKNILAAAALTVLIGTAPALAQEQPTATPAPEAAQPAAKTDTADATKKAEPAARPRRIHHLQYSRYNWPWDWAWYQWRRELHYLQHHRI
jgi:hypothetical protein